MIYPSVLLFAIIAVGWVITLLDGHDILAEFATPIKIVGIAAFTLLMATLAESWVSALSDKDD